ncbi:MAG: transposase [candidate division KSB1 bacterium]|nr:transposase [candidate division KSB1 bacterium]
MYEKTSVEGKVKSVAVMVAYGVDIEGEREVLAVEPMWEESEDSWKAFIKGLLKRRGVKRVGMDGYLRCTSGHPGGGEEGACGHGLAEVQGAFYEEHPGPDTASGQGPGGGEDKSDLAAAGPKKCGELS